MKLFILIKILYLVITMQQNFFLIFKMTDYSYDIHRSIKGTHYQKYTIRCIVNQSKNNVHIWT